MTQGRILGFPFQNVGIFSPKFNPPRMSGAHLLIRLSGFSHPVIAGGIAEEERRPC
jgi:hypothetical protein